MHQPLHVSFVDDRGGNQIRVTGPCSAHELHGVWDSCIIDKELGADVDTIATELMNGVTQAQIQQWRNSKPIDWANESFHIATEADVEYCVEKNGACFYSRAHETFDASDPRTVDVDQTYLDHFAPIVRDRLRMAGVRLAMLLEQALGQ